MTTGQHSRVSRRISSCALAAAVLLAAGAQVSAHRLDEYLQATRIDVRPDGIRIGVDLTPGADVAPSILTLIDLDADGALSSDEQEAYASAVTEQLDLEFDGERLPLRLESFVFAPLAVLARGDGTIQLNVSAGYHSLPAGAHRVFFGNRHVPGKSAYLANALVPESDRVSVTAQHRTGDQRELTIDYSVASVSSSLAISLLMFAVMVVVFAVRFARGRSRTARNLRPVRYVSADSSA